MPKKRKIEYHVQVASSQLIFLSYWKFAYIQGSYKNKNQVIGQMTERNRRIDVCFNIWDLKSHDMNSLKINYGSSKIKYQWLPVKKFTMPNQTIPVILKHKYIYKFIRSALKLSREQNMTNR